MVPRGKVEPCLFPTFETVLNITTQMVPRGKVEPCLFLYPLSLKILQHKWYPEVRLNLAFLNLAFFLFASN